MSGESELPFPGEASDKILNQSVILDFSSSDEPVFHYEYLHYCLLALGAQPNVSVSIRPVSGRLLARLIELGMPGAKRAWRALHRRTEDRRPEQGAYVRLTFTTRHGKQVKAVIDFWDSGALEYPEALQWCDVYFKTNFWPTMKYPRKVLPLVNGNGRLSFRDLRTLQAMRTTQPTRDFVYWAQIWEPRAAKGYSEKDAYNIVEHQIRLFESLSTLTCDVDLIAVVPGDLVAMRSDQVVRRLEACGVRVQADWGDINTARFWAGMRSGRIVFLRTGTHHSISWRLTELLAMGACIAYDGTPYPNWPAQLVGGVHYLDGQCAIRPDFTLPTPEQYRSLVKRIADLLVDAEALSAFRNQAARYYDAHCRPEAVGAYIVRCLEEAGVGASETIIGAESPSL